MEETLLLPDAPAAVKSDQAPERTDWSARLRIRRATRADVSLVRRLVNAAFAEYRGTAVNFTGIDQDDAVTAERMAACDVWLAYDGRRAAATVSLEMRSEGGVRIGEISQFAVAPAYKGRGVGSAMLTYAEEQARAAGAGEARLSTAEPLAHLMRFYAKRGYLPFGRLRRPGKTYDSLILSKRLG